MKKSCDERMWHSSMVLGPEDEKKTGQGEAAGGVGVGWGWDQTTQDCVRGCSGWPRGISAMFFEGFIPASM